MPKDRSGYSQIYRDCRTRKCRGPHSNVKATYFAMSDHFRNPAGARRNLVLVLRPTQFSTLRRLSHLESALGRFVFAAPAQSAGVQPRYGRGCDPGTHRHIRIPGQKSPQPLPSRLNGLCKPGFLFHRPPSGRKMVSWVLRLSHAPGRTETPLAPQASRGAGDRLATDLLGLTLCSSCL